MEGQGQKATRPTRKRREKQRNPAGNTGAAAGGE